MEWEIKGQMEKHQIDNFNQSRPTKDNSLII